MRSVLALSLCLLAIAALMRLAGFDGVVRAERAAPDGGLTIVAAGRGSLQPPARVPGGEEILDDAILIGGDLILKPKASTDGLRLAVLAPGLVFEGYHSFDLAGSGEEVERFLALSAAQPEGAALVLTTYGAVLPADDRHRRSLSERFVELGADRSPFRPPRASWALITVRRPQGWVKLAEGHGEGSGVVVTFILGRDLAAYDGYEGETTLIRELGDAPIELEDELGSAIATERTRKLKFVTVGGEARPAIESHPIYVRGGRDRPSFVMWRDVPLGPGAQFTCGIGLKETSWDLTDGATFSLRIDGEVVHSETLSSRPPGWRDWAVDLDRFAGRTVTLELVVDPGQHAYNDRALWGSPRLTCRRPPPEPRPPRPPRRRADR
jgi:hypothetical protein